MAEFDTSIYRNPQGAFIPQVEDPIVRQEKLAKLLQFKNQAALSELEQQQLRDKLGREKELAGLYAKAGGDKNQLSAILRENGKWPEALQLEKELREAEGKSATAAKANAEAMAEKFKIARDFVAGRVNSDADMPAYKAFMEQHFPDLAAQTPTRFDPQWKQQLLTTADEYLKRAAPQLSFQNTGNAVVGVNPYTGQQQSTTPVTPQGFNRDAQGNLAVDPGYLAAKAAIAQAGKTSVNVSVPVNTDRTLYGEVAKGIGEEIVTSRAQARNATTTIQNVQQMADVLKSGNFISGPGANAAVLIGQIGSKLGVAGEGQAEKIANTRSLIQAMAKNELSVAGELKGQGQITENERKLIARAASGDITMTAGELRQLGQSLDKTARSRIRASNQNATSLQQDPRFSGNLGRAMTVEEPPPVDFGAPDSGRQTPPTADNSRAAPRTFQTPPDPAQNRGKWMTDAQGTRYQSDGTRWVRK